MYILTKLKQQGLAFAAFFYALAITNIDCYSKSIVPMANGSNESNNSWTMQGVTQSNDIFHMNAPNSYIETKDYIDLKKYKEITISIRCKASGSKENSALNLQVSDDGINWKDLSYTDFDKENKKDIIEKNYSFKYEDFIAHDKVKLRYYCPRTNDLDYLNVTSINIDGIIKSIEYPQITGTKQIGGQSFTIDWQPIDNADSYQLALYKKVNKESNYNVIDEDFSTLSLVEGSFDNIDKYLPHWSTVGCKYRTKEDNHYISISNEDNKNNKNIIKISELDLSNDNGNYTISFDYQSQEAGFRVIGNYDDITVNPEGDTDSWKHYSATFSNGNKNSKVNIKINDSSKKSEVMIDNLLITQNRPYSYELVSGYPITVENKNSYKFDRLEPKSEYCCTVIAANELATSKVSDPITFKTAAEKEIHTGINTTSQDNTIIRASEGYLHINSPVVTKVNVYSIIGKLIYTEQGNSIYEIPLPEGMYIVKCDNKTTKISIY